MYVTVNTKLEKTENANVTTANHNPPKFFITVHGEVFGILLHSDDALVHTREPVLGHPVLLGAVPVEEEGQASNLRQGPSSGASVLKEMRKKIKHNVSTLTKISE